MAKRTEAGPKNPEVGYERKDIGEGEVTWWGVGLVAVAVFGALVAAWAAAYFVATPHTPPLPPAAGDDYRSRRPGEPFLEGLRDLEQGRWRMYPPRGEENDRGPEQRLEKGGPGVEAIEKVFRKMVEGKGLPSSGGRPAPERTPNRSTSGREVRGEKGGGS